MLARYPFELPKDKPLAKREMAQALRWAIEAELDAVNFYEQLAEHIEDKRIRHILLDVADEEKEHFGEFMAALMEIDESFAELMKNGFREVEEETGIKVKL